MGKSSTTSLSEVGKESGPDKITITLVKDASEFITHPLMPIYNSLLANGVFLIFGN